MRRNSISETAQALLDGLGILQPNEIDVELIAYSQGAIVEYIELAGCEASILGCGDNAFINVNKNSRVERQRFSIAHELGHWCLDRGAVAAHSITGETLLRKWSKNDPEVRANRFASDLLMPTNMFTPRTRGKDVTLATARSLAEEFTTSLTATVIRLVEKGDKPSIAVMTNRTRVLWFVSNEIVPRQFFIATPGAQGSLANSLLRSSSSSAELTGEVRASDWLTLRDASSYSIMESSIKVSSDEVLSILWWDDEKQILDFNSVEEEEDEDKPRRWNDRY